MTDLRLSLYEDGPDVVLVDGDLELSPGLEEAVLYSLFSDARASADELADEGLTAPRGWWGEDPPDRFGSKLWLLERAKLDALTITRVQDYAREALAWMLAAGVAQSVDVRAIANNTASRVDLDIEIVRGSARQWSELWSAIEAGSATEIDGDRGRLRILYR